MDKFGVFNLLNSLLTFYEKKKNENPVDVADKSENGEQNLRSENSLPSDKKISAPLQKNMLGTLSSHDAFIKRVKERNLSTEKKFNPPRSN